MRDEYDEDLPAEPSFMKGQCEQMPLLMTTAQVDDPAWQEGETHLIVNGRQWYLANTRGLTVEDLVDTLLH